MKPKVLFIQCTELSLVTTSFLLTILATCSGFLQTSAFYYALTWW